MSVTIRDAVVADCRDIAALFLISSDGLAEYIWSPLVQRGETPLDAGERRYARRQTAFSFENCQVATERGRVVGMVHAFPMERDPDFDIESVDPVLRPYAELEDYGSLYVSGIAVYDGFRNQGIGSRLLAAVETRARTIKLPRVSLICFEGNAGAMRL